MDDKTHYIHNYNKIKYIVKQLKKKILELEPNIIYKDNTPNLCYDQVIISIKYNKLLNYKKQVEQLIDLLVETNKHTNLLEELLQEINECITILEPLKIIYKPLLEDIKLLDIELLVIDDDNK